MSFAGSHILAVGFVTWAFFFAGAGAMAIPVIIHILNRRRYKTVTWAAMEFLLRAMRKNRRRLRFEQWILLATRCLVLLVLGMALARPLGCENPTMAVMGGRAGVSVFVIDASYSMAYEVNRPGGRTHLDNAKRVAKDLVDRASRDGGVAVVVASSPARAIVARPSYNPQDVKDAIDRIEQSYTGTDLPGALQLALGIAKEAERQPDKTLHLFTDSTQSAWRAPDQAEAMQRLGPDVARVFRAVSHHNLSGGEPQANGAVLAVRPQDNLVTSKFPADFAARVRGYGSTADSTVQWRLNDAPFGTDGPVKLTPDAADTTRPNVKFTAGGPQVVAVSLGSPDRLTVDDTRWRVVDVAAELRVLIVEGRQGVRAGEGSGFFLREALSPPSESGPSNVVKTSSHVQAETISVIEFGNKVLAPYAAVVLADVAQIAPTQAEQLERYVKAGGTLMLFMGDQVNAGSYNDVLLPRKLIPGQLAKLTRVGADEKGSLFDFDPKRMPYLRAFENTTNTGLETVETLNYWQVDVPQDGSVQTVLGYRPGGTAAAGAVASPSTAPAGAGDAAITVHSLGDGRVVFCSTTANAEWTTFPSSLSYAPVMHELVASTVRTGDWWLNVDVGQPLSIPAGVRLTVTPALTDPAGRAVEVRAAGAGADPPTTGAISGAATAIYRSDPLRRPGVYALQIGTRSVPVAVNVPATEADVRTLPDQAIRESLGGIDLQLLGPELPPDVALSNDGNDLSWAFMIVVLALLAVECIMAMHFGHYRRAPSVPSEAAPTRQVA